METIRLQAIPNQEFSITLNNNLYELRFKSLNFVTIANVEYLPMVAVDIIRSGTPIVLGQRCVAEFPLIPYPYIENGNFLFLTADYQYPTYQRFGIDQYLVFASQAELEAIRGT